MLFILGHFPKKTDKTTTITLTITLTIRRTRLKLQPRQTA